ncbi:hypothetical protein EJ02DRAFT_436669 [Clathrospora elynae]|uniref:Sister chromatid cohesion protein n=1 Tax=Clathrospora elynae TaxID=706981 RepID=A0A6A5SEI8_9PLEO|nr:hypothetical protein EJ02DRAFT_436669 [Clathrospora elynae]
MAAYSNGDWHNANGGGLPHRRPPTVDEALPYSPFTSIIPFSPDIIPFPTAEPPTPPSTLNPDQQKAATKAVGILNDEIKGQSTAQHLHDTLNQLRNLLHRDKLPQYHFKPMPQLATPPPESPTKDTNGSASSYTPKLSPFASMLLKQTGVGFAAPGVRSPERSRKEQHSSRQVAPPLQPREQAHPQPATPNGNAYAQNASLPYTSSATGSTPVRPPGPAVLIQQRSGPSGEYRFIDTVDTSASLSQKKEDRRTEGAATALKPHQREIADKKIDELESFVTKLSEDKDDLDGSQYFTLVPTPDGEFSVLNSQQMDILSEKMSSVVNLGRFAELPVDLVMDMQSLLHPTITSATKNALFPQDDSTRELTESIETAKFALKASKLLLETMIEGRDDYRMRREEIVDVMIDLVKLVKDACIVPIVQSRRSGGLQHLFNAASAFRPDLQTVLRLCGAILTRFARLIGKYNLSDRALNTLEYLTVELLVEPNSDHEKDSVFTIKKFEQFRQKTMDVLAQIFARHPDQRTSILNGIFSNLEKLPDKKASARQFSSAREKPIMTISALFMRFVQVAATNPELQSSSQPPQITKEALEEEGSDYEPSVASSKKPSKHNNRAPIQIAQNLTANATSTANTIATSLCERASNTSKTGDKPFRNLLDLFIDDFCNVLGSPQWPAAVMLLQMLLVRMHTILQPGQGTKQSVIDKDMALTTMARIGCGVIDFKHGLRKLKKELDISQSDLSSRLDRLVDDAMSEDLKERVNDADLLAFDGPYRMIIESLVDYLDLRPAQEDPHLQAVSGCLVSSWLSAIITAFPEVHEQPQTIKDVQQHLESMIVDSKWLARKYKFQAVSDVQSKLAAGVVTLQSQVCRFLPNIVNFMQSYVRDKNSSKLRTRGTTGLQQLLDKDPRVISEPQVLNMVPSLKDDSPMVREATLSLLSKCLAKESSLERQVLPHILELTTDPSNGPKRKAIKLLKDVYLRATAKDTRLRIAASLLLPSQDDENAISELSRNVLEEIWLTTAVSNTKTDDSQHKLRRVQRASFMVDFLEFVEQRTSQPTSRLEAFEKFFVHALSPETRGSTANLHICQELVADLVDEVIGPETGTNMKAQARIMNALSVFAKVKSTLFTIDHLRHLKLYIKTITTTDDIALVRPTVVILRHVLPTLPLLQHAFAEEIRLSLMRNVSKLAKCASDEYPTSRETLLDVVHCLWAISAMSNMNGEKIFVTISSVICQLRPLITSTKEKATASRENIISYLILLGTFGQVCSLDDYSEPFVARLRLSMSKNQTAKQQMELLLDKKAAPSLLLLDTVRPFTMQTWEPAIREQALRSLGGICQQSPELFMRAEIERVVKLVFINEDNDRLKRVALSFFSEYFAFTERRSDTGAEIAVGQGVVNGSERLETSFVPTENDSATPHLAEKFYPDFVVAALKNNNELAVSATNIIASLCRQGLIHPRHCGATLVALGTSMNKAVAQAASDEYKRIHEKQESYLEPEYMHAIRLTFKYQLDMFNDSHGMVEATHTPKLAKLFEVLKVGKKTSFRKFINNVCKQVDFDFAKLDASGATPEAVLYARFCLENLALLDLPHLEEVAVILDALEAMVLNTTGPAVALVIGEELPKQYINLQLPPPQDMLLHARGMNEPLPPDALPGGSQLASPIIDDGRLRQITTACMILQMVWETRTFVRRCYNVHKLNGPIPQKDYAKTTNRNNFVSGKELWERLTPIMSALNTRETMMKQCYEFADLLDVDRDIIVGDDGEDTGLGAGYETPNEDAENSLPLPTSGRGRKRKSNVNLANTPKKQRGRLAGTKNKKRTSRTPDGDDNSD